MACTFRSCAGSLWKDPKFGRDGSGRRGYCTKILLSVKNLDRVDHPVREKLVQQMSQRMTRNYLVMIYVFI